MYIKYETEVRSLEYWSKPHNIYLTSILMLLSRNFITPLGCYFLKRKKKNTKTLQNSLAKAPKMQRKLKYIFARRAGVTV